MELAVGRQGVVPMLIPEDTGEAVATGPFEIEPEALAEGLSSLLTGDAPRQALDLVLLDGSDAVDDGDTIPGHHGRLSVPGRYGRVVDAKAGDAKAGNGKKERQARASAVVAALAEAYPGTARELCALEIRSPFELLVATILSAQCTDERVNSVTPALFDAYPDPEALCGADPVELEQLIRPTGFFHAKARNLLAMASELTVRFGGEVPRELDHLVTLPGVGRKTGNVVRTVAFDLPGLPVDTHVGRLSRRLGLTESQDPVRVESDLNELVPEPTGGALSLRMILHGRKVCTSRKPRCDACVLADLCPSAVL